MTKESMKAVMSSDRMDWATPQDFFDMLNKTYNFTLDVCASKENAKCAKYFDEVTNGLAQSWAGERCWMNPPYGREIAKWVKKAREEGEHGTLVVGLLPVRTDTRYFSEHIAKHADLLFVKGRLRFDGGKSSAPFPSMLAVWGENGAGELYTMIGRSEGVSK